MAVLTGASPALAGYAAIVVEADSGRVLHEQNADTRNYPASLTKMMTLYMLFAALRDGTLSESQRLAVSARAARQPPSRLGLAPGDTIRVSDAIQVLVTKSANDVAVVVAEALGGSERQFGTMMTRQARQLGMERTTFRNASGLPHSAQMSTARDMAVLAQALLRDFPSRYAVFSQRSFTYSGVTYRNHNRLLGRYDGIDGIKTGYIRASGFNLAASAERDGRRLIAVVFGGRTAQSRDGRIETLLDRGFRQLATLPPPGVAPVPAHRPFDDSMPGFPVPAERAAALEESAGVVEQGSGEPMLWGIQIGAFQRYDTARERLRLVTLALPDALSRLATAIEPVQSAGAQLYRARLLGLNEDEARRTCELLTRRRLGCLPVPPDDT